MNVLIYWEDRYFQRLQNILSWVRGTISSPVQLPPPNIYPHSARGLGQFQNFVERGWPIARSKGITNPKSQGPIDVLICVADADRAEQCCPGLTKPPRPNSPTSAWLEDANEKWTEHLRTYTSYQPTRILGRFLRWNKESVVISCFDQQDVIEQLSMVAPQVGMLDGFSDRCEPDPRINSDTDFVDTYRSPGKCLMGMMQELGHSNPGKNQQEVNDALGEFPRLPPDDLLRRIPDLVMLAETINGLHATDQLLELTGVTLTDIQAILSRLQGATNKELLEIISEAEGLLGADYRILGQLALDEGQSQEHREYAARLFSTLLERDERPGHLKVDEQATLALFDDYDDELLQEAVLEVLSIDEEAE